MPMVDVLIERLGKGAFDYFLQHDRIHIVPLAYLRGSSFNDCYIHCTEAQNTTPAQVEMLLTRVGENAQVVLDGDPKQSDLKKRNGLEDARVRLEDTWLTWGPSPLPGRRGALRVLPECHRSVRGRVTTNSHDLLDSDEISPEVSSWLASLS